MPRVLTIVSPVRAISRIGIIEIAPVAEGGDILESSHVRCGKNQKPFWTEKTIQLQHAVKGMHGEMLENFTEKNDVVALIGYVEQVALEVHVA
jgi:hypothetical protein